MREMIFLITLLVSSSVLSDTRHIQSLIYYGQNDVQELNLSTEKTRTEYRNVQVPSTCYRPEHRVICENIPPRCRQICDRMGRCRNECVPGRRFCAPRVIQVPYPCTITQRRPIQVHDYFVQTNAKFNLSVDNNSETINERIILEMNGETDHLTVKGSKNYFVLLNEKNRSEQFDGRTKNLYLDYHLNFINAFNAKTALANGFQNVTLRNNILTFSLGAGFNLDEFTLELKLFQHRRFGRDNLTFQKYLSKNDIVLNHDEYSTSIEIDLNKLPTNIPYKKRIILNADFKLDQSKLLNKSDIVHGTSTNWVFK